MNNQDSPAATRRDYPSSLQNLDTGFNTGTRSPPTLENPNFSEPPPLIPHPSHDISANLYVNGEDKQQYATNPTPFDPSAAKHQKTRTNLRYHVLLAATNLPRRAMGLRIKGLRSNNRPKPVLRYPYGHVILRLGFIYGNCRAGNLELPLDFIGFPLEKVRCGGVCVEEAGPDSVLGREVIVPSKSGRNSLLVKGVLENLLERISHKQLLGVSVVELDNRAKTSYPNSLIEFSSSENITCFGLCIQAGPARVMVMNAILLIIFYLIQQITLKLKAILSSLAWLDSGTQPNCVNKMQVVVHTFVPFYPVRIAMFVNRLFSVPTQLHLLLKSSPVSDHLHHSTAAVGLSDCTTHGWDAMTAMNSKVDDM
ncbi:hypothetical protein M8C21_013435 [Ambrosia artemisiifolia]|uniref:Uncharacterized protein n=1 Tax=Ambrosia artemisiifolia TaxID=4212 RepID=A0AAD5BL00_AMBAR|nr:hypothetical protein M8C21_013435 [Ambrosia artemisiifolia]